MIGYEFEHEVNETWTVRQNLRQAHLDIDFTTIYGAGYAGDPADAELARFNFITQPKAGLFTVDNQIEARFATGAVDHTVLAGVDYKRYEVDEEAGFELGPPFDLLNPDYLEDIEPPSSRYLDATTTQDQLGLYLQDQIEIGRLNVVLSGRHDWVETEVDNRLAPANSYDSSDGAFSGRAGAIYNFDNGIAPYVAYSRSFLPTPGVNFFGEPFKPETAEQIEAGFKYQADGAPVLFTASAFHLTRQNVPTPDPNNPLNRIQTGEIRSRGVEFEAQASLAEGLDLVGAFTLYDLEVTEGTEVELGHTPVSVPETLASLWLDYTFQSGTFEGLGFGGGIRHIGRSFADQANEFEVPEVTLLDAALHYERNNWRAAVNVSNLLDETYVASCFAVSGCFYGDRREITLKVGFTW